MYSRVTGQLVGSRETLGAARKMAGVRFFASMRADMPSLMLQTVESLLAQRTLVGPGKVGGPVCRLKTSHAGDLQRRDCGGHVDISMKLRGRRRRGVWGRIRPQRRSDFRVQQIGEIHCRRCALHVRAVRRHCGVDALCLQGLVCMISAGRGRNKPPKKLFCL